MIVCALAENSCKSEEGVGAMRVTWLIKIRATESWNESGVVDKESPHLSG